MSKHVELTDTTLDKYDVLKRQIKEKWPDWKLEYWFVCPDGTVNIRIGIQSEIYRTAFESRYINAKWSDRKQLWKLTGDIYKMTKKEKRRFLSACKKVLKIYESQPKDVTYEGLPWVICRGICVAIYSIGNYEDCNEMINSIIRTYGFKPKYAREYWYKLPAQAKNVYKESLVPRIKKLKEIIRTLEKELK